MFADADQYELQAASVSSPMKSPHRYSPSVYSHQVPHNTAHTLATTANCGLPLGPPYTLHENIIRVSHDIDIPAFSIVVDPLDILSTETGLISETLATPCSCWCYEHA